jgi:site-specific recombinase XerD
MRSTFKVLFYLKRDKVKKNGNVPLFCRITVDGQEVRFSMKCDVNPKFWDVKAGKASGRTTDALKINVFVENVKAAIYRIYRDLQERDNYVTAERVRNVFLGAETKQQTLLKLFDKHNEERKLQIGTNICKTSYCNYVRTRQRLAEFMRQWYDVSDISIKEIDHKFICDFEAYLIGTYQFAHNTLTKYLFNLKHVIQFAIDKDFITKNPFSKYSVQYKDAERGFLTQDEVEKLIEYKFDNEKLEQARDVFVFCCFTGLSHSDVYCLTKDDIQISFDGKFWIKGRRQKTDVEYNIPILHIPQLILDKYANIRLNNSVLPVSDIVTYNIRLKQIGKLCGITKNMSSHLARHTFATTITLTKGVPIETVSKMLGHTSIKTTQIYAKVINSKISNDMNMLAEKLSDMEMKLAVNF